MSDILNRALIEITVIQGHDDSITNYPAVTELEDVAFNRNFIDDNIYTRLNRLENKIFGSTFPNESLIDRVDRLKKVLMSESFSKPKNPQRNASGLSPDFAIVPVYSTISTLENDVFGRTFDNDLATNRVQRLERKLFGTCQSGTIEARLKKLSYAVQNTTEPQNNNFAYNSTPNPFANTQKQKKQNSSNVVLMGSDFDNEFFNDNWDDDSFFSDNQAGQNNQNTTQPKMSGGFGIIGLISSLALPIAMGFLGQKFKFLSPQNNYYPPYQPPAYNYPYPAYPSQYANYPYRPVYTYPVANAYNPYTNTYYNVPNYNYQNTNLWNAYGSSINILP